MVYLDIYDTIFEYLEKRGMVGAVLDYSEAVMKPLMSKNITNEFYNELVIEFALFNFWYEEEILIDFLAENLYDYLSEEEKVEFDMIMGSERYNLKFAKKIRLNRLDTKNLELYDFYFIDTDAKDTKIIVSSTSLDEHKSVINARLIDNPLYEGKYAIIGGIFDKKVYEIISEMCMVRVFKERFDQASAMVEHVLKFGKEHSLKEIEEYENERSRFIEQDRKIMALNRQFFEKFNIGFDDFLEGFFELSNNAQFVEMAEYYLSILDKLKDCMYHTNYIIESPLWHEKFLISGFLAFVKKDFQALHESIVNLQKKEKEEFENRRDIEIAMSREKIMENQRFFLVENIAPLGLKDFNVFMERLDTFSPENIGEFLAEITNFLEVKCEKIDLPMMDVRLSFVKRLARDADKLPYLREIENLQKYVAYNPEVFYEYMEDDNEIIALSIFLLAVQYIHKNEPDRAYRLLKQNRLGKTGSFDEMFLIGKLFSFFEDEEYKFYSKKAKENDKNRYRAELEIFLRQKEQRILLV